MIQSNELRIGNWVKYYDHICQIKEIKKESGIDYYLKAQDGHTTIYNVIDAFEPIPLTPEIAESVGLGNYFTENIQTDGSHLSYDKETKVVTMKNPVKYVHELQNLWFALTGEELEIQL